MSLSATSPWSWNTFSDGDPTLPPPQAAFKAAYTPSGDFSCSKKRHYRFSEPSKRCLYSRHETSKHKAVLRASPAPSPPDGVPLTSARALRVPPHPLLPPPPLPPLQRGHPTAARCAQAAGPPLTSASLLSSTHVKTA